MNCRPNTLAVFIKPLPVLDMAMGGYRCGVIDITGRVVQITLLESTDPPCWRLSEPLIVEAVLYGSLHKAAIYAVGDKYMRSLDERDGVEDKQVWKDIPVPRETLKLPAQSKKLQGEKQ